jgi:tape measure domain-containing protein
MAIEIATAFVQVVPSMKGVGKAIESAFGSASETAGNTAGIKAGNGFAGGFGAKLGVITGIAQSVAGKAIEAFMGLSGEITSASDSAQKFASTLNFAGVSERQIKRLTASTQDYADKTVYDLNDIRNTTAQLAANGVPNYDRLAEAAGNLNAVAGGSADTFKSVAMVLTQTAGQGKLTTENWNQLSDAIPGASGKIQQALKEAGAYTGNFRDAMADGQITAQEFNDAIMSLGFTDAAVEAATSASTIEGATGNLEAAFVKLGASVLDTAKPAITGGMSWIADGVTNAVPVVQAGIEGLIGWFQRLYSKLEENGAITAFKSAWDTIRDAIMGVVNMVIDWAHMIPPDGLANGIKLVADTLNWFVRHGKELAPIIIGIGTAFAAVKGYQALNSGLQALTGTMNTVTTAAKGVSNGIMLMTDLGGPVAMLKQMAGGLSLVKTAQTAWSHGHEDGDRRAGRVQRRHSRQPHRRDRRRRRGRRGRARMVLHPDRGRAQGMGRVHLMAVRDMGRARGGAKAIWNGLGEFLANLWSAISAASPAHGRRSPRSCPASGTASARPPRRYSTGYATSSSTCSPSSARSSSHPCRRSRTASTPCSAGYSRSSPSR